MRRIPSHKKSESPIVLKRIIGLVAATMLCITSFSTIFAAQMTTVFSVQPSDSIAATPISIPRPIRLEKIMQLPDINQPSSGGSMSQMTPPVGSQDTIVTSELIGVSGNQITLRMHYLINPSRPQPIYAGAFLYDASRRAIDAGYKPVAISAIPKGSIDVVLVLPKREFISDYVVTFLMESGKPVFVNGRFKMAYSWKSGVLREINDTHMSAGSTPAAGQLQSSTGFCEEYAKTAVGQYNYAITNNLPGIGPPVWSNNSANHYNWCLGVPRKNATQGSALRQGHIDRYKHLVLKNVQGQGSPGQAGVKTIQAVDKAMLIKPIPNKQLDPGRGP